VSVVLCSRSNTFSTYKARKLFRIGCGGALFTSFNVFFFSLICVPLWFFCAVVAQARLRRFRPVGSHHPIAPTSDSEISRTEISNSTAVSSDVSVPTNLNDDGEVMVAAAVSSRPHTTPTPWSHGNTDMSASMYQPPDAALVAVCGPSFYPRRLNVGARRNFVRNRTEQFIRNLS
jgi:hypothetical protein